MLSIAKHLHRLLTPLENAGQVLIRSLNVSELFNKVYRIMNQGFRNPMCCYGIRMWWKRSNLGNLSLAVLEKKMLIIPISTSYSFNQDQERELPARDLKFKNSLPCLHSFHLHLNLFLYCFNDLFGLLFYSFTQPTVIWLLSHILNMCLLMQLVWYVQRKAYFI